MSSGFYEFLTAGPPAVPDALTELRAQAEQVERDFAEHDEQLVPELAALKADLIERAPEADDSNAPPPQGFGALSIAWTFGFANFDRVAIGADGANVIADDFDRSRSGMLLRILRGKLRELQWTQQAAARHTGRQPIETNQRPELDDLARRLRNLDDRHRHAAQTFTRAVKTKAGFRWCTSTSRWRR
jgi:hypothetical protein